MIFQLNSDQKKVRLFAPDFTGEVAGLILNSKPVLFSAII